MIFEKLHAKMDLSLTLSVGVGAGSHILSRTRGTSTVELRSSPRPWWRPSGH